MNFIFAILFLISAPVFAADENETDYLNHYNQANKYYRQGDFDLAFNDYLKSINTNESKLQEWALFNIGNTLYRQNKLEESLEAFKKVLEINPENKKAKLNHDFVNQKIQNQPPQENKDENNNEEKKEDKSDQENKDDNQKSDSGHENDENQENRDDTKNDENKDQPDSKSDNQDDSKNNQNNKPDEKEDQPEKNPSDENNQQDSPNQPEPNKEGSQNDESGYNPTPQSLSQEEAEQWLNSLEDNPKGALHEIIQKQLGGKREVDEDW